MKEPKFSDAPCYGIEFNSNSKICRVCLANRPCQRIVNQNDGARHRSKIYQKPRNATPPGIRPPTDAILCFFFVAILAFATTRGSDSVSADDLSTHIRSALLARTNGSTQVFSKSVSGKTFARNRAFWLRGLDGLTGILGPDYSLYRDDIQTAITTLGTNRLATAEKLTTIDLSRFR